MRNPDAASASARMLAALRRMLYRYPYHAEWLCPERWHAQPAVGTMAVTIKGSSARFLYSPAFVGCCSDQELEGVIHHELNHLVFGHPRLDPSLFPNRDALLIAEEVTVNEHVHEPLPANPMTLNEFPELPPGEDTIQRYHRLADRNDLAGRARTLDMHALWSQGKQQSMQGGDAESIYQALTAQLRSSRSRESLCWGLRGEGLHDLVGLLESLGDPPKSRNTIDWSRILFSVIGARVRREATYHRPPRRMPDQIGVVPGTVCRPEKPPVVAAIDTSSSMQRHHFERIRAELDQLRGLAEVTVVQCDKEIRKTFALSGPLETIVGRGGTDLRPPLQQEFLDRFRPSLVVYFTDGDGPVCQSPPSVPVVWCLTSNAKPPASWGRVIRLG